MNVATVYLGLGGNLGDVITCLITTIETINNDERCLKSRSSSFYKTEPWGYSDQPDFINAALELEWTGTIADLMSFIESLESNAGRDRDTEVKWGPRTLDIDILVFGDERIDSEYLTVPHPQMKDRRFVLAPLAEIAGELVPPGWLETVIEALKSCSDQSSAIPIQ